jgi:pimeloyl-ACP methyl ester carboxylesterase
MKKLFLSLLALFSFFVLQAQYLKSSTFLGERTMAQLAAKYNLQVFKNGVKYYKVVYHTTDIKGNPSIASGLVVFPDNLTKIYPLLAYQHGTISTDKEVPSALSPEADIPILFAGLGYITVAADYLGFGESPGFHPYVHAATEASAAIDLLRAAKELAVKQGAHFNQQVFITGYSQGGHAAMALHRKLELELNKEFQVAASAPMSGPYSMGEVMREMVLSEKEYLFPGYIPNTVVSYQLAYGNLYKELTDVFKSPYAALIDKFAKEELPLSQLNVQLVDLLKKEEGSSKPVKMFQPAMLNAVMTDSLHPFNVALRDNNVYQWAPKAPTRLYYCKNDDQVSYVNSVLADSVMRKFGAIDLQAIDVNPLANHGQCVSPAIFNALLFFSTYQKIQDATTNYTNKQFESVELYPNPAQDWVIVKDFPFDGMLIVRDLNGIQWSRQEISPGDFQISTTGMPNGVYFLEINSTKRVWRQKLLINKQ